MVKKFFFLSILWNYYNFNFSIFKKLHFLILYLVLIYFFLFKHLLTNSFKPNQSIYLDNLLTNFFFISQPLSWWWQSSIFKVLINKGIFLHFDFFLKNNILIFNQFILYLILFFNFDIIFFQIDLFSLFFYYILLVFFFFLMIIFSIFLIFLKKWYNLMVK